MCSLKYLLSGLIILAIITGCHSESQTDRQAVTPSQHSITSNGIEISQPWARPAPKGGNSAVYMQIFNGSNTTDTLRSVDSNIAKNAQIHESFEKKGLTGMRPANDIIIAPDSSFSLSPGGFHVMLMEINQQVSTGDTLNLQLSFARAGTRTVAVPVKEQ